VSLLRPERIDWNPSLSPQTVRIEGHSIFYVVKGEGDPLILIHGFGAGLWIWEKVIDPLSASFKVYALDLIGHGFSDRPKIAYRPVTYVHFLKNFMDAVEIEKATLIGNSMGGGVAWAMAIQFPERVKRIVLINSVPPDVLGRVRNKTFKALAFIEWIPLLPYLVIAGRDRDSIKEVLQECVDDLKKITPEIVDRQYQISNIKGTTWVLSSTLNHAREALQLKASLSKLSLPTLLVWGDKDLLFPMDVGEDLHRSIPGSRLQVIHGSGHIPMWETPDEVYKAILSFLE